MWNMGILFLIYYCVTVYSAKNGEANIDDTSPLADMGTAESQQEELPAKSGEEVSETVTDDTSEVIMTQI